MQSLYGGLSSPTAYPTTMKRILLVLLLISAINSKPRCQYADLGTGALKNYIWWFDWNNFVIANGASKTITTADGLNVTLTFSNVQGPVFEPYVMNTWYGSVLHFLYDFSNTNIKPALFSPYTTQNSQFTITITATRNGQPASFKFIAADAEASATSEITTLTSSGTPWLCVDFFRNSSQTTNPFGGCNTTTASITDTYAGSPQMGQNPVIATDALASGSLTVNCNFNRSGIEGKMAIAFGIFSAIDRGDLPAGYGYVQHRLAFTNNNPCNFLPPLPSLSQTQNLKLGAVPGDSDGSESTNDNASGVDEEAITSFAPYTNNGNYSLTVPLSNTTGSNAYLTGWFDINRNGVFDANESVTNTIANNATVSTLTWTGLPAVLPAGPATGWAFRLRLSSSITATQSATGFAPDGEVEDYITTNLQATSADFLIPDTVCVNTPVNIVNSSSNASSFFWNFCVANVNSTPAATNLGNIGGQFGLPVFIDYAQYNGNWYGFVTNNMPGKLTRLDFGNSLLNTPTAVNLGNVGGIVPNAAEGIQMAFVDGRWYAIIVGGNPTVGGSRIVKIDFGPNLTNTTPVGTNWGNIGNMNYPGDLHLFNDNGNWYAFTTDASGAAFRFSFGPNFQNPPAVVNLGTFGGILSFTTGIYVINENAQWHAFIINRNSNTIARLDFGNSLLNTPTAVNLGNPNNTLNLPRDIYLMKFCDELVGFVVNEGPDDIVKLNFTNLLSVPSAVSLGNVGNLSFPHSISKLFRVGADVYSFIPNVDNNTLTRLNFTGCTNSSIPNFNGAAPPPVTYTTPGTYNINLTIDDGLPTQASICKQVVVIACTPPVEIDFNIPDTVCVNEAVNIQNTSQNASSYYWSFCTGNLNAPPTGTNLGNINGASGPVFMDYVQDNNNYYGFVTDHFSGKLFRLDFGNSLLNNPVRVDLGTVGGIVPPHTEGIQVIKNEGQWYAIIVGGDPVIDGSRIVKIAFGTNIANPTPVGTNWGNIGNLSFPHDLYVFNDNNGNWYGLTVNAINNTMTRFNFTNSFSNTPTAVNLGNVGNLSYPTGIQAIVENGTWYAFVANAQSSTLTRLNFGNSLLNTPTGVNLGNINGVFHGVWDIHIIKYCGDLIGYMINSNTSYNDLLKLNFGNSLTNTPTAVTFGNLGNMSFPHCLTKIFRVGADLYSFVTNVNNQTITRMRFEGCTNASMPSSTAPNPPSVTYNTPGTYNISLTIDDGLPTQETLCKQVVVKDCGRVISGVINDYTEVLAYDPCKNALTVANASAFNVGDTVLMIQMKGAVIDSTNTAAFGTVTDYKNAGNYEYNYVKGKTGNVIELTNVLLRGYDIPYGKVQLVRVPYYQNSVITSTLTCLPWDGGKGGVLAFNVADSLHLAADIDVSKKGFRGGAFEQKVSDCAETGYFYDIASTKAALKGESIVALRDDKVRGRGKSANGGGGGNDHNAGGGGGANGGKGGNGGKEYMGPGAPGCVPQDNGGIGGAALAYSVAGNKIFLGGGGGAGDVNGVLGGGKGGDGGGIVIIAAGKLKGNHKQILSNGENGVSCTNNDCWEGFSGGGAGGTVLMSVGQYLSPVGVNTSGGNGGSLTNNSPQGYSGPGGGGGGGILWVNGAGNPPEITYTSDGGEKGLFILTNSDGGAQPGDPGLYELNLSIPVTTTPFTPNIDSVRIKDSSTGCASFDFKGLGYTKTHPIVNWQWYFGDGNIANTQNTSHTYATSGTYTVKLVVTDANGCKDSITTDVISNALNFDFSFKADVCDPLTVQFYGAGLDTQNPYWAFGDATTLTGVLSPLHTYASENTYVIRYAVSNGACADTITKSISLAVVPDNIIRTTDTTICLGATKQLLTEPSLNFCWTPTTYLDNPHSANPITSTPEDITYYYTAEVTGSNLVVNGDFSQGNTGFASGYTYNPPPNTQGAQYFVGTNSQAWNVGMMSCGDHTTGTGNMMMVNGSPVENVVVWSQTINIQPNTTYAFSTWIQNISFMEPAKLQFSINGKTVGSIFQASATSCLWQQFYTTWNSGDSTRAVISIVNKHLVWDGNDFGLDDISFAPVFIKRDSVKINVDTAFVKTIENDAICKGRTIQLTSFGASSYSWTPATGLNDPSIANPIASPSVSTQYIVTGTNANGCTAKDTVDITVNPGPTITKSPNQTICKNSSVQLFASGGTNYVWTPAATLNNPNIADPIASPTGYTKYYVTVTDANTCTNIDSVEIDIHPDPHFTINAPGPICFKDSVKLVASGGDIYTWQADPSLSNTGIADPVVKPAVTTTYTVTITETVCNNSATLSTSVTVNPLPNVTADKSNDLDCSNDRSQLSARGATSYLWTPASTLSNPAIGNPVATPTVSTQYIVKGTDLNGCVNYDTVLVNFVGVNKGEYLVANAFTPNNDGVNDCFGVKYWGVITQIEFSIYNRWGERIFFTNNPNDCWNGTYKGQMQDIGVYVYMIKAKTLCGDTFRKGTFALAR